MSLNLMKSISIAAFVALNASFTTSSNVCVSAIRLQGHEVYQESLKKHFGSVLNKLAAQKMREIIDSCEHDADLKDGVVLEATKYWEECMKTPGRWLHPSVVTMSDKQKSENDSRRAHKRIDAPNGKVNQLAAEFTAFGGDGDLIKESIKDLQNSEDQKRLRENARRAKKNAPRGSRGVAPIQRRSTVVPRQSAKQEVLATVKVEQKPTNTVTVEQTPVPRSLLPVSSTRTRVGDEQHKNMAARLTKAERKNLLDKVRKAAEKENHTNGKRSRVVESEFVQGMQSLVQQNRDRLAELQQNKKQRHQGPHELLKRLQQMQAKVHQLNE